MNEELKKLLAKIKAETNEEFKSEVAKAFSKTYGLEDFKAFADTEDGKKVINSVADARVTKGIDTYKETTMPGVIKTEVEKAIEKFKVDSGITLTDEQQEIAKLKAEHEKLKASLMQDNLRLAMDTVRNNSKLPKELRPFIKGKDVAELEKNIADFSEAYAKITEKTKKETMDKAIEEFRLSPGGSGNLAPTKVTADQVQKAFEKVRTTGSEDDFIEYTNLKNSLELQTQK